jgi:hypothetical protein
VLKNERYGSQRKAQDAGRQGAGLIEVQAPQKKDEGKIRASILNIHVGMELGVTLDSFPMPENKNQGNI